MNSSFLIYIDKKNIFFQFEKRKYKLNLFNKMRMKKILWFIEDIDFFFKLIEKILRQNQDVKIFIGYLNQNKKFLKISLNEIEIIKHVYDFYNNVGFDFNIVSIIDKYSNFFKSKEESHRK